MHFSRVRVYTVYIHHCVIFSSIIAGIPDGDIISQLIFRIDVYIYIGVYIERAALYVIKKLNEREIDFQSSACASLGYFAIYINIYAWMEEIVCLRAAVCDIELSYGGHFFNEFRR